MKNMNKGCPCACCGFLTMSDSAPGTYEICPICFWEDDEAQCNNIDLAGGANEESLREARGNFKKYGVSSLKYSKYIRAPLPYEIP